MEQSKFYQIKNVTEKEYTLVGCDGSVITRPIQDVDKSASAFTIQDAKSGDVLVSESECGLNTWYCIFKSLDDDENMTVHCYLARDGRSFQTMKELCANKDPRNVKPATKEQRDTLKKAMADAGWEFDFDKKELKKIEPIDEYEGLTDFERTVADVCIGFIGKEIGWKQYVKDNADTLLKIAVKKFNEVQDDTIQINPSEYINDMGGNGCYLKNTTQMSAWSEEDERLLNDTLDILSGYYPSVDDIVLCDNINKAENWLKALKERVACEANCTTTKQWKPSEQDILLLERIANGKSNPQDFQASLGALIEQLKKLREE